MAVNGQGQLAFTPVITALATLQSTNRAQKKQAHEYLEQFQKSPEAWSATFGMLQDASATIEAQLFAATTLKGKIIYDLHQLPRDTLSSLRDTLLSILVKYSAGPKPIRTQLCVCLANLAIQMAEWKDVLERIVSTLGKDPQSVACVLEFLHVLPEEVTEGRKINLSEEDLAVRTTELLSDNAQQVLQLLVQYSLSSASAAKDPLVLECVTSWLREVPVIDIVNSPLLNVVLDALSVESSFDAAVDCLSTIFKETRDVDECLDTIQTLLPRILVLRPRIVAAASAEDADMLKGITRIFAEAAEAWVVLIARMPEHFRGLVEAVLECAAHDEGRDAISITFNFWYELKQFLTLDKYMEARLQYVDIYSHLVDVMIDHLQFPKPDNGNELDLFAGDKEREDKFRDFRHHMGDVLKDCCSVMGVTECLKKPYQLIEKWIHAHGSQVATGRVPDWQALEAPLFSMRAMGRMVPPDENIMLPRLMSLIVQIPDQEKVRFQAVLVLGRYTEWTASHPETLQSQLNYIMAAFEHKSKEVVSAAALSFKFFCCDCADLLKGYIMQLQQFYESVIDRIPFGSQEEVTEGVASVVAKQSSDKAYSAFKLYCDPVIERLKRTAQAAVTKEQKLAIADQIQLVTIFVQWVQPSVEPTMPNPAVRYCEEIFPVLGAICDAFITFTPIVERICRCWRHMVLSYRSALAPLLPMLAGKLADGFTSSRQGCFLWATDAIVREFSEGVELVDDSTTDAIFAFFEQQTTTFLRALNDLNPEELPDVIEDYFRLGIDILLYHPFRAVASPLMKPILSAACSALTILKQEPLLATLHFLRDLLGYGGDARPSSNFDNENGNARSNPFEIQTAVKHLIQDEGEIMTQRIMTGMMFTFPEDCFPDASGVLLAMFQLLPQDVVAWIRTTLSILPAGSITVQESERLLGNIELRIRTGEARKVRTILQDFTNAYRRRNVAPREGLGRLEATKFRFAG